MSDAPNPGLPEDARRTSRQKVAAFARYKGTSAWRKDHRRAREYARFLAAANQIKQGAKTPTP
jgi:hypothetical protein